MMLLIHLMTLSELKMVAQAIARQPEAAGEIRSQTFLLAILVEGAAILLGLLSLVL